MSAAADLVPPNGARAVVAVIDHGPGIDPENVPHVFERFWRADQSRQRSSGGSGLGLSIVAAVVAAHGGQVVIRQTPGGGATFVVQLPAAVGRWPPRSSSGPARRAGGPTWDGPARKGLASTTWLWFRAGFGTKTAARSLMTQPFEMMSGVEAEHPWRRLIAESSATGGVFTASRAAALGIDKRRLYRLVTAGTLVREARGVYRLAGTRLEFADRVRVATERTGGVASHNTAARLWGFEGCATTPLHVTVRHGVQRAPAEALVVHTTRRALDAVVRDGVPVTRPSRTALDLAGEQVGDRLLLDYVNSCVAQRLLTVAGLGRFLAGAGRVPGCARLRALLASLSEVDSVAEARLVEVLVAAGVTRPVTQFTIRDGGRFVARVDLAWPARRVVLELDGYRYHADVRSFVSDRERGNRIVACGWVLLRTTPATVRDSPTRSSPTCAPHSGVPPEWTCLRFWYQIRHRNHSQVDRDHAGTPRTGVRKKGYPRVSDTEGDGEGLHSVRRAALPLELQLPRRRLTP